MSAVTRLAMGFVDAVDILHRITSIIAILTIRHPLFLARARGAYMIDVYVVLPYSPVSAQLRGYVQPNCGAAVHHGWGNTAPSTYNTPPRHSLRPQPVKPSKVGKILERVAAAVCRHLPVPLLHTLVSQLEQASDARTFLHSNKERLAIDLQVYSRKLVLLKIGMPTRLSTHPGKVNR